MSFNTEFEKVLDIIKEPRMTIDWLTLLVYSPHLSARDEDEDYKNMNGIPTRQLVKEFQKEIEKIFDSSDLSEDVIFSRSSELYKYHYRIKDIDLQFCSFMPITSRCTDEKVIEVFGDDRDKERGYMVEHYDNDYNIRIEFNPNNADIGKLKSVLYWVSKMFHNTASKMAFIRVSRIDFAFDYPIALNPCLVKFKGSRINRLKSSTEHGVETVYFGSNRSDFQLTVYNKKLELMQNHKTLYSGDYLWRVELRCYHSWYLQNYPGLGMQVLPRIDFFSGVKFEKDEPVFNLILQNAVHWGIKSTLDMFPKETRRRYLIKFKNRDVSIVHPSEIYFKVFPDMWDNLRNDILYAFGFEPMQFLSFCQKYSTL